MKSSYRGSENTRALVKKALEEKFGPEIANSYDPYTNVMTMRDWNKNGYKVVKGQSAIRSVTMIEKTDESGTVIKRYPKRVYLFHISQCEKVGN